MLKDFYLNEGMRNEVKEYLRDYMKALALEKVFSNESVVGVAEGMGCIEKAFENLEVLFAHKSESKEIKNEAR